MGVATAELPSFIHSEAKIPASASSMSQGFHEGNIFSFSDEFERPQQNHVAQQSRRDKLRVQQHGFEAAATSSAATGNPLVTIQEEEEDSGGIYGPAGTSNMLSEMFNFTAQAPDLHLTGQGTSLPAGSYHRLIQQRPDFYGGNRHDQVLMSPDAVNWSSVLAEDAATAAKHHGMNTDSSTAMRHFFMNPSSAAASGGVAIQPVMQHQHRPPSSPPPPTAMNSAGIATSLHHHHPHHGQAFLSASFGEAVSFGIGEGVLHRQLGPSLSLSSSALQQLEMRKAEDQLRVSRSDQGSRFFLNNISHQQEHQLHPNSIHQLTPPPAPPPPPPPSCLLPQAQLNQVQPLHMSYAPVTTVNVFRNTKFARPAQELLEEFCSVGRGHARGNRAVRNSNSSIIPNPSHSRGAASTSAAASSSSKDIPLPLSSSDRFENQRKKSKLLSMLDEKDYEPESFPSPVANVERRYNHYCEQMQMVVNSFDSVMGFGAATPYTALAQKAMSRHFRCLKDAIVVQLRQACELLGDKDGGAGASGGLTKGETPKLRLIDQSLRQQRAFHQLGMMDHDQAWRPQRGLPDRSVTILRAWLFDHFLHPYPSDADKHLLARQTGLSRNQVSNWFINARVRLWKPMVEDMYQQEAKEEEGSPPNEEEANSRRTMPPAEHLPMPAPQHQMPLLPPADSGAPECVPGRQQPPPESDDATAAAVVFSPASLNDDMYRRATAMQARFGASTARTGDLSLTLGLRHAGGNPPETGRFGL